AAWACCAVRRADGDGRLDVVARPRDEVPSSTERVGEAERARIESDAVVVVATRVHDKAQRRVIELPLDKHPGRVAVGEREEVASTVRRGADIDAAGRAAARSGERPVPPVL